MSLCHESVPLGRRRPIALVFSSIDYSIGNSHLSLHLLATVCTMIDANLSSSERASIEAAKTNAAMAGSSAGGTDSEMGLGLEESHGPDKQKQRLRLILCVGLVLVVAMGLAFGLGFGLAGRGNKSNPTTISSTGNEPVAQPTTPALPPTPSPPPAPQPIVDVKAVLTPLVWTPEKFESHWTLQSRALVSLEEDEMVGGYSPERLVQRYALKVFYFSTNRRQTDASDAAYGKGNFGPWREPR